MTCGRSASVRALGGLVIALICLLACGQVCLADSLFSPSGPSLYSDKRTLQVGDLVTILIQENAQAVNSTQTTTGKAVGASASLKGVGTTGINASAGLGDSFKDSDTTARKGSLVARMTARVEEVLPNGDALIAGTRTIVVNNEKQTLTIRGIVRQQDIGPGNSVASGQVGNAEIRFDGSPDWQKSGGIVNTAWEGVKAFFTWLF